MSSITAGTSAGTALVHTADTTGSFVVKTGAGSTTGLTVDGSQIVTLAQPLPVGSGGTGATSLSGITTGTATNLAGGSNGTIPYQSASGTTQMLAVGTPGQLLQSNGAAAPTWVAASSGALTLLSTVTASNSATVDIETTFSSTYDAYLIVASGVKSQNNNRPLFARMKLSGSYVTTASYKWNASTASSSNGSGGLTSTTLGGLQDYASIGRGETGSGAAYSANFQIYIHNPSSTTLGKTLYVQGVTESSADVYAMNGFASNSGTGALTGLRLYFDTGNIVEGKFRLYGISTS